MAKNRLKYLCALVGCFGFYIAYQEWLSWLLLMILLGLPWFSLALSLPFLLSFRVSVAMPDTVPQGEKASAQLLLQGSAILLRHGGRILLTRRTTGEQWKLTAAGALPTDHCGALLAQPDRVWVCDLLGLFRFQVKKAAEGTTLVRPQPLPMAQLPDLNRLLFHSWRPKPGGGFAENHEMRQYRPGDSLNQLHWKLTAKTGRLTIREPMEPDRGPVLLTLDISGTAGELDRKFGRLLWLGNQLCGLEVPFEIRAMTRGGIACFPVRNPEHLEEALDRLLLAEPTAESSVLHQNLRASWHRHIGGEPDAF